MTKKVSFWILERICILRKPNKVTRCISHLPHGISIAANSLNKSVCADGVKPQAIVGRKAMGPTNPNRERATWVVHLVRKKKGNMQEPRLFYPFILRWSKTQMSILD